MKKYVFNVHLKYDGNRHLDVPMELIPQGLIIKCKAVAKVLFYLTFLATKYYPNEL